MNTVKQEFVMNKEEWKEILRVATAIVEIAEEVNLKQAYSVIRETEPISVKIARYIFYPICRTLRFKYGCEKILEYAGRKAKEQSKKFKAEDLFRYIRLYENDLETYRTDFEYRRMYEESLKVLNRFMIAYEKKNS